MPQASIEIGGVVGSNDDLPINVLVQLSNDDVGGEATYAWVILDQPDGAADALSDPAIENPTFTPKKEGTYRIQLTVNAGLATEDVDVQCVGVRQLKAPILRQPAYGEAAGEVSPKSWAPVLDAAIRRLDSTQADPGVLVGVIDAGGHSRGDVLMVSNTSTVKAGLPGEEFVPTLTAALATDPKVARQPLYVLEGDVAGNPAPAVGALVRARKFGLFRQLGVAPIAGSPMYVTDLGTITSAAGTYPRQVGIAVNPGGGACDVDFDGAMAPLAIATLPPSTISADAVASAGSTAQASRSNHAHACPCDAPAAITCAATAAEGAAATLARSDHGHEWANSADMTATLLGCISAPFDPVAVVADDDVTIFAAAPFRFRIVDVLCVVLSADPASTGLTLRDAAGGGGAACSATFDGTAATRQRDTLASYPVIHQGDTFVVRRTGTRNVGAHFHITIQKF